MLIVMTFCSPPYSASASVSAVSVLPTPDGPHSMNTPIGLFGLSRLGARRLDALARSCPARDPGRSTRWSSVSARFSTVSISFFTMRPTGMPVQSPTTEATACSSTLGRISGDSPCSVGEFACSAAQLARAASRSFGVLASAGAGASAPPRPVPARCRCPRPAPPARAASPASARICSTSAFSVVPARFQLGAARLLARRELRSRPSGAASRCRCRWPPRGR